MNNREAAYTLSDDISQTRRTCELAYFTAQEIFAELPNLESLSPSDFAQLVVFVRDMDARIDILIRLLSEVLETLTQLDGLADEHFASRKQSSEKRIVSDLSTADPKAVLRALAFSDANGTDCTKR